MRRSDQKAGSNSDAVPAPLSHLMSKTQFPQDRLIYLSGGFPEASEEVLLGVE